MKKPDLHRYYENLVNALSFSSELYKLRRELNTKIDIPDTIAPAPHSHPLGVTRWFKKRRISIAEAYLMVIRDLESKQSKARLRALRLMVDVSFHAKSLDLPLNTARVQMALIKEAVKNRGNRRRQLELLQDFSVSSHGQYQVIRKLCDELNIIELPETGSRLKNLDVGWDEHVHDTATSGRKNATQLLIDAFIKGISELTIAYGSAASLDMMEEAIEAGRIVGIRVNIGLEFSMLVQGRRFHFMTLLPTFKNGKDVERWFKEHSAGLKELFDGLERNQVNRIEAVRSLLKNFDKTSLKEINEGYPGDKLYTVPKLRMKNLSAFIPLSSINRMHLGEFLYSYYKPVLFNRVLLLKVQMEKARGDFRKKLISEWDFRIIDERYSRLRNEFRELNPDQLRKQYFTNPKIGDYQTVFDDMGKMKAILSEAGCTLKVLHPLEYGLDKAKKLLEKSRGIIDRIEIYNMQDSVHRDPDEILQFARFLNDLNIESSRDGLAPYIPVCGSDSTGRSPKIPGMGFIRQDRIGGKFRQKYIKRHVALPAFISAMIEAGGKPVTQEMVASAPVIFSMGKISGGTMNLIGDEPENDSVDIPITRAWRYMNPGIVNLVYTFIGFVVANYFIGPFYAFLWLFITGFRNSIADLVANRGIRLSEWNLKSINFGNVARSLFWTGFSVPILGFVKAKFDVVWPWGHEGILFNSVKFFFISFSNGLYLATHNTLRGFDKKVVRANFFRSVIAWPFATAFAPLGDLLGIPSIVQTKIWSDFVAGFIEGSSKYMKILRLRRRDLEEIIPRVISGEQEDRFTALLDLLFLYREEPRTESSLKAVLDPDYHPMGILKDDKDARKYSFSELYAAVMDDRSDHALVDFILAKHEHEVAVELSGLVAVTLPSLRDWLASRSRQFLSSSTLKTEQSGQTPSILQATNAGAGMTPAAAASDAGIPAAPLPGGADADRRETPAATKPPSLS